METTDNITWINLPEEEKLTILSNIAEEKGIKENAVEKDFWVSMVLKAIFSLGYRENLVFKGGTSLSKGWGLIERFSEDCDLSIDRSYLGFGDILSKKDRTKLRKKSKLFIENELSKDLNKELEDLGLGGHFNIIIPEVKESDKDPVDFFVEYNSCLKEKEDYIKERVKIEISCRSMLEPFENVKIRSMIEDAYPDESFTHPKFTVPTAIPGRTFLEKVFLLHEEFNRPGGCSRLDRLTRHMYDVEKMMDCNFAKEAMADAELYEEIVKHRQNLTAWSGLDYKSHKPSSISFVPNDSIKKDLTNDYAKMQESFIYGESLKFDKLMDRLKILQERFRALSWENECKFFNSTEEKGQTHNIL